MSHHVFCVIHPEAKIGENVTIEPFVTIAKDVVIGNNTWIGSHVSIMEGVRIGENCKIFPGAIIGGAPQDLKFKGEYSTVEIGNNVIIREYCTINKGTEANERTIIGNNCLLMAYVHVAHDCVIEERCILANNVTLAGHIHIGKYAVLGGLSAVHQFVKIGEHVMIGGGSLVRKDVPPYIKVAREPISYAGVNSTGLLRRSFTQAQVNHIQDIYRLLFVKGYNLKNAIAIIEKEIPDSVEKNAVLSFVKASSRGIMRGFRNI